METQKRTNEIRRDRRRTRKEAKKPKKSGSVEWRELGVPSYGSGLGMEVT